MRSMRAPLGSIDTRVTMTDSPVDGLSPSFASVLAFDDIPPQDSQALEDPGFHEPHWNAREKAASNKSLKAYRKRTSGKRHSRLELDVAMDKYHSLDGLAEPLNPQNTPASISGPDSPEESGQPSDPQSLRTSSAPQIQRLAFEWSDDKGEGDSYLLSGDTEDGNKAQKRHFSANDSSNAPSKELFKPMGSSGVSQEPGESTFPLRCVRFSPPPESPQKHHSPRRTQRPIPTVERKANYIASYRQQKQFEKWRGATRARTQRTSPHHSPSKESQHLTNPLSRAPEAPQFSSVSTSLFHQGGGAEPPNQTTIIQGPLGYRAPEETNAIATGVGDINEIASSRQGSELVSLSICIYRIPHPGQPLAPDTRASVFQVQFTATPLSAESTTQQEAAKNHVVSRIALDDLLWHTHVVVPAFLLRIPVAIVSAAQRVGNSQIGTVFLYLEKMFWSIMIALFIGIVHRFFRNIRLRPKLSARD